MLHHSGNSEAIETTKLSCLSGILAAGTLTFAIPGLQWAVSQIAPPSPYRGSISSILVISCLCLWYRRVKTSFFLPPTTSWRVLVSVVGLVIPGLLAINILNEPVSKITSQARSPFEVIDVILLVPLAEELIFRGVLWSVFERLARSSGAIARADCLRTWSVSFFHSEAREDHKENSLTSRFLAPFAVQTGILQLKTHLSDKLLVATSLLFGVEHLGYWAQTGWPLPPAAFLHALSMVAAGLGFGVLRWKSRSLAVPIVIHMLANGVILLTQ